MQRIGVVEWWNNSRGFGFLAITRAERYFLHASNIVEGPVGDLTGLKARFDVDASPVADGSDRKKLPLARNVTIEGGA